MKVIFANDSLAKLKYLALSEETGSGYLRTNRIGKYIIITDLITGDLSRDSIKKDLKHIYDMWGSDFGGIFMKEELDLSPEYFLEKMILKLGESEYNIFYYNSDNMELDLIQKGSLEKN